MDVSMEVLVSPSMPIELTPSKGMQFESDDIAYNFYNEYGRMAGFSIRKKYVNKCKKIGIVTSRRFVCEKEEIRGKDKRDSKTRKARAETRCGCNARLGIVYNRDSGKYIVTNFIAEHNHNLHLSTTVSSQRRMSATQAAEIDLAYESGIRLKDSYQLMSKQVGGSDNLGFTKRDHKNYLRNKRQRALKFWEAASLEKYFRHQLKESPSYFYAFQLDVEELITNIFWVDVRMIIDYNHFGDVITFDTTYSTNRDARPLGVFLGLNHHRETVIFGVTLLYDETIESFIWLFETFLEAMSENRPITIFTDQDATMTATIQEVMPDTYHALCSWHMWQNANRHLGYLLKGGSRFNKDFLACIYEYDDEDEFLSAWNIMLEKYDARENKWLIGIFQLKEKWAQAYVKRTFTVGMRSTQLSERFNCDLKDCLQTDLNILEFFTHFERVVKQKRDKELEAEYNSRQKLPRLNLKSSLMLNQVAKVYTPKTFELFQNEVEEVPPLSIIDCNTSQVTHTYVVGLFNGHRTYKITWNPLEQNLSCSCQKFETFGILCRHALKIFGVLDIKLIPDEYIIKRWRKDAKDEKNFTKKEIELDIRLEYVDRYRALCPKYIQLVNEACEIEEGFNILNAAVVDLKKRLCDAKSCQANAEEDNIRISTTLVKKEDQPCVSITVGPKGIKKKVISRNKKRRLRS
jgi:zinc finger SWIM domain-containing protein 3